MRNRNISALLFSNMHDEYLPTIAFSRSMGSVPFGGRYRLIDFPLSNLANAGITNVGIIAKNNYRSLIDHIGSGKEWDLSRRHEGLYFLPPLTQSDELYNGRISSIQQSYQFSNRSGDKDYVMLIDCNVVGNIDYDKFIQSHIDSDADITLAYKNGTAPNVSDNVIVKTDEHGRIVDLMIGSCQGECKFGIGLIIIQKGILVRLVDYCINRNLNNFNIDILQKNLNNLEIRGSEITEYTNVIHSLTNYYNANMALFDINIRNELFMSGEPIYTKVRDAAPAKYGLHSVVDNSLVADGCRIDGEVHGSILFRDVVVAKGATVKNSIIMQGSVISEGANLDGTILDKNCVIRAGKTLCGTETFPVFVNKGLMV